VHLQVLTSCSSVLSLIVNYHKMIFSDHQELHYFPAPVYQTSFIDHTCLLCQKICCVQHIIPCKDNNIQYVVVNGCMIVIMFLMIIRDYLMIFYHYWQVIWASRLKYENYRLLVKIYWHAKARFWCIFVLGQNLTSRGEILHIHKIFHRVVHLLGLQLL
jgi:hypothetical protein